MGARFINAGVAEQNMISVAAGLARGGLVPWAYSIAPFIYARPFEQIRNDICAHRLPVRLVGPPALATAVAFGPGGALLATGYRNGIVHIWKPREHDQTVGVQPLDGQIESLEWGPPQVDGPLLLAAGVAVELATISSDSWHARLVGRNALHCLGLVPLLAAAPAVCPRPLEGSPRWPAHRHD
jgi:WD40 repeat protein